MISYHRNPSKWAPWSPQPSSGFSTFRNTTSIPFSLPGIISCLVLMPLTRWHAHLLLEDSVTLLRSASVPWLSAISSSPLLVWCFQPTQSPLCLASELGAVRPLIHPSISTYSSRSYYLWGPVGPKWMKTNWPCLSGPFQSGIMYCKWLCGVILSACLGRTVNSSLAGTLFSWSLWPPHGLL